MTNKIRYRIPVRKYGFGDSLKTAISDSFKNLGGSPNGPSLMQSGIGAVGTAVGQIGGNAIGGGLSSGAGNTIGNVGGFIGGAVSSFNPVFGGIISAGSGLIGGAVNRLWGSKLNKENIAEVEGNINALNSFTTNASDFDQLSENWSSAPVGMNFSKSFIGKDGTFSNTVSRKYRSLKNQMERAVNFKDASLINNANNITLQQLDNMLAHYTAFGGQLQTNGADFTNGIIQINEGGTHESNPNEGVLFGMDSEGIPNLVEEGETIFNDYVFSNRIKVPEKLKEKHKLKGKLTFSDAAKELAKESEERPNDPISKRGLEYLMNDLMTEQEMIKAKRDQNKYRNGGRVNKYANGTSGLNLDLSKLKVDPILNNEIVSPELNFQEKFIPKRSNNGSALASLRYVPAIGAVTQGITDALGITNNPDYRNAKRVEAATRGISKAPQVRFSPIGNYLTYRPMDRQYYINQLNAAANASRRGISNSGLTGGAKAAAILAADNNYLSQLGTFARQAEEYNRAQEQQVENFNRGTNQYNSEGAMKAGISNAESALKTRQMILNGVTTAAGMRQAQQDASDAARSSNITNALTNIGDIGTEEYWRNVIKNSPYLMYDVDRGGGFGFKRSRKKGGYLTIKKRK